MGHSDLVNKAVSLSFDQTSVCSAISNASDVPDHVVDRQRQRSRIGLQHAPENVVMRRLLIEEVIAHCVAWLDRAHDLAEGLR